MDRAIINIAGLCSGVGMLDEAVRLGCQHLGIDARPALLCEWEAYAAACLLARMEESSLEPCPIWCGDLRELDCRPFRGLVDVLCAGLPCQPYSCAGKQRGHDDERSYGDGDGPIPHFLRIVGECRPAVVFVENVPPWVSGGWFRPVGEELCRLGYTLEDPLFVTAEAVGASHRRERVFVLAHALRGDGESWAGRQRVFDDGSAVADAEVHKHSRETGNGSGSSRQASSGNEGGREAVRREYIAGHTGSDVAVPASRRRNGKHGYAGRSAGQDSSGEATGGKCPAAGQPGPDVGHAAPSNGSCQRQQHDHLPRQRGPGLADAECPRPQGDGPGIEERRHVAGPCCTDGRVFAPGPQGDWAAIPQHLWPAIEPGFRLLVDGLALALDESRTDQLRCGGNGVVAVQGAVAFVELMRRVT